MGFLLQLKQKNNPAFHIILKNEEYYLVADNPGQKELRVTLDRNPEIFKTIIVTVQQPENKTIVTITVKNETENIFPLQKVEVPVFDLNNTVENRTSDYSGIEKPVLAHAIVTAINKAGSSMSFRDDEKANGKLYLYSVEKGGLFTYGWGGLTTPSAFAKGWIARIKGYNYINDLEKVSIYTGDTIFVYHISDLLIPWELNILTASSDSVSVGELLTASLYKATCKMEGQTITEEGITPVNNATITVMKETEEIVSGFTNGEGKYTFSIDEMPPLLITSENNAVLIHPKIATGVSIEREERIGVFPNPFRDAIYFSGHNQKYISIVLTNLNGQEVFRKEFDSLPEKILIPVLPAGQYLLKATGINFSSTFKLVKN